MTHNFGRGFFNAAALSILLYALIALLSCSTSKKVTTTNLQQKDSSTFQHKSIASDTASMQRSISAKDIDFTITYGDGHETKTHVRDSTFLAVAHKRTRGATPLAFTFIPDHSRIVSITGHIGSITDTIATQSSSKAVDTSSKTKAATTVVQEVVVETKKSWLSTYPWWILFIIIGVIGLGIYIAVKASYKL